MIKKAYLKRYKRIRDDINDKAIRIEAKIEIKIESLDMQQLEVLLHLIRKLKFDK